MLTENVTVFGMYRDTAALNEALEMLRAAGFRNNDITLGGLVGSLVGAGIPAYEAKRYEGRVKSGGILLSVDCDDSAWLPRAKKILEETCAEDISSTGGATADYASTNRPD